MCLARLIHALVTRAGSLSVTSNARMLWAFSRDGAVPGSSIWHKVDPKTKIPRNAVWGMVFFAMLLGCAPPPAGLALLS